MSNLSCHILLNVKHGESTRGHNFEGKKMALLLQKLSTVHRSQGWGLVNTIFLGPHPQISPPQHTSACWNVDWLVLAPFLCRQPELLALSSPVQQSGCVQKILL